MYNHHIILICCLLICSCKQGVKDNFLSNIQKDSIDDVVFSKINPLQLVKESDIYSNEVAHWDIYSSQRVAPIVAVLTKYNIEPNRKNLTQLWTGQFKDYQKEAVKEAIVNQPISIDGLLYEDNGKLVIRFNAKFAFVYSFHHNSIQLVEHYQK